MEFLNVSGPYIREARLAKGWTEADLARELEITDLGLSAGDIVEIEARKRVVNDEELSLIAIALDVSINTMVAQNDARD